MQHLWCALVTCSDGVRGSLFYVQVQYDVRTLYACAVNTAAHEPLLWSWVRSVPYELQAIRVVNAQAPFLVGWDAGSRTHRRCGSRRSDVTIDSLMSAPS